MTEKEKCRLGLLYGANYDSEILADRERTKELLKKLLGKTGENLIIGSPFACDYGYSIEVGKNFYANVNLIFKFNPMKREKYGIKISPH